MNVHPVLAGIFALAISLAPGALSAQSAGSTSQGSSSSGAASTPGATTGQGVRSGSEPATQSQGAKTGAMEKKAETTGATTAQMSPKTFVKKAAQGGMAEVKLGQLAVKRASNPDVKSFAEMMVNDHSKANDDLKSLAKSKKIAVPTSMDADARKAQAKLSKLSGARFDQAYMTQMVADHQKAVNLFEKASSGLSDAELRQFASTTLPTIQKHLDRAREIQQTLGGAGKTSMNQVTPTSNAKTTAAQH